MAWSVVQAGHASGVSGNSYTATAGAAFTAGNLVVCMATWGTGTSSDLTSFAIGAANAVLKNATTDVADTQSFVMGYFLNNPGGTSTLNINGVAGTQIDSLVIWAELTNTGVAGATFDNSAAQVQNSPGTGAGAVKTGTAIGASGELVVGFTIEDSSPATITQGSGFTIGHSDSNDPNFFGLSAMLEWIAATGAIDPSFTISANGSMLTGGMAFAIGGGSTTLTLGQKAWNWNGQAPLLTRNMPLAQKAWVWSPHAVALQFSILLAQKGWVWAPHAMLASLTMPLVQKAWHWAGNGIVIGANTIALALKAWAWAPGGIVASLVQTLSQKAWHWVPSGIVIGSNTVALARALWRWVGNPIPGFQVATAARQIVHSILSIVVDTTAREPAEWRDKQ